jgi:LytR cell envelope-related transcriptional attenuator
VDHPLTPPDALVRPWRLAAFVATTIAAIELLVLLVIGGGALADVLVSKLEREATAKATMPKAQTKSVARVAGTSKQAVLPRNRIVVRVLNGNGRTGAAAAAASRVRSRGYKIAFVGNASRTDFAQSLVMFKPGFVTEARRLARDFRVQRVGPLDGMRPADLGRAHVVFILGT